MMMLFYILMICTTMIFILISLNNIAYKDESKYNTFHTRGTTRGEIGKIESTHQLEEKRKRVNRYNSKF